MQVFSIGDMAHTFMIRRQSAGLKTDMTRLGNELATGQKQNLGAALSGDFGPLAGIERSLVALTAYKTSNTEAAGFLAMSQSALGTVQDTQQKLAPGLLTAANARDATLMGTTAEDARQKLFTVVSALNTRFADRSLFAGTATDKPALSNGETMLADIAAAASGQTTAAGVIAAVETWFDASGGGFETTGYLGSGSDMAPLVISDGETAPVAVRADDPPFREMLKGFVLAGLVADGTLAGDLDGQAELMKTAAEKMMGAERGITELRAGLGAVEARVEDARARNSAEATAYKLARSELVAADPYQTATEFQAVQARIETLYTVTSRIAGLTFTDYMP